MIYWIGLTLSMSVETNMLWISPAKGDDVKRCPWLRKLPNQDKYICRIHDVKPEHCRAYPKSRKHALKTGCRGFEN
jgi:Fe-S-cluster containining protein